MSLRITVTATFYEIIEDGYESMVIFNSEGWTLEQMFQAARAEWDRRHEIPACDELCALRKELKDSVTLVPMDALVEMEDAAPPTFRNL